VLDQLLRNRFPSFFNPIRKKERKITLFGTTVYQAMKILKRAEYNSETEETKQDRADYIKQDKRLL